MAAKPVLLPARLDTSEAVALWERFAPTDATPVLDGSKVTHLGVAGLQVLMKLAARCGERGGRLQLAAASDALRKAAALMGAGEMLSAWEGA